MKLNPLRLDQAQMIAPRTVASDTPRYRVMRLCGTAPLVADALAETTLRFTLVAQSARKLRFA